MTRRAPNLLILFGVGLLFGDVATHSMAVDRPQYAVISRGKEAGPYQAFPDVCRLPNGDLACVFYAGYGHVSLPNAEWPCGGRICLVQSSDDGRTWSEPKILFDGPQDDRDPHIAALRDGTLVCSFFQYRSVGGKIEHDVCLVESRDGGRNWQTEPRIMAANRWAVSAPVRELPDGTRLLGVYTGDDSTAFGAVLRSTDGGKSWSEPVAIDPKSGVRLDAETDVLLLPDGTVLAALRGDGNVNMHFATSPDQGLTWSKVKDSGFLGHCPHLTRLSSGEILLTHRQPATSMHFSRDNAKSWQGPIEIDAVGGAYPSTVELKAHTVLVVYYEEGEGSAIRAARFRVTADSIERLGLAGLGVGAKPIAGAEVILDGTREMLDQKWTYWKGPRFSSALPIKWQVVEDPIDGGQAISPSDPAAAGGKNGAADIVTKKPYRDFRLHVEFLIMRPGGNSGVYLQNRYEIQVLDGDKTTHGMGAVINETDSPYDAYLGVGKWNAYDIVFRAARFNEKKIMEKARVSMYFNGKKVHDNVTINQVWGGANSGVDGGNDDGKGITDTPQGLKLQAEGHDVRYRNIWIKELNLEKSETDFKQ